MAPTGHQDNNRKISGQGGLGKCQLSVKVFTPQRLVCMQYTWPRTWSRSICELCGFHPGSWGKTASVMGPVRARHKSVLEEPPGAARIFGGQDSMLDSDSHLSSRTAFFQDFGLNPSSAKGRVLCPFEGQNIRGGKSAPFRPVQEKTH